MVLGFNENFEAYIASQYPENISKTFDIKASDLMNIYTLHRMDKKEPNFYQMEIKHFTIASFFTGSSSQQFIGMPEFAITAFFSNKDIEEGLLSADFEGFLRRIAHEILPKKDDQELDHLLEKYYIKLKEGNLEPYWEISDEKEKQKIGEILETKSETNANLNEEIIDADQYKLENKILKEELKTLEMLVEEKSEKIRELTKRISETVSDKSDLEDYIGKCSQLEEENELLRKNMDAMTEEFSKESGESQKLKSVINELERNLETKDTLINELDKKIETFHKEMEEVKEIKEDSVEKLMEIDKLKKEKESLLQENEKLKKENESHIDSIADLKLQLRQINKQVSSKEDVQSNLNETIIDLKKEIKVLRRERDHYKEIIKEHDLL